MLDGKGSDAVQDERRGGRADGGSEFFAGQAYTYILIYGGWGDGLPDSCQEEDGVMNWTCSKCETKTAIHTEHPLRKDGAWKPGSKEKMFCRKCMGNTVHEIKKSDPMERLVNWMKQRNML